jgi:FkbM family methyltransferase
MRLAQVWANHFGRGTGWVPRKIGRALGRRWKTVIATEHVPSLAVDPRNLDVYTGIRRTGAWERHVVDACIAALGRGGVFYDIGANAGYISLAVAERLGESVDVLAFEPQPTLAHHAAISARLSELKRVRVFPAMIGDRDGTAELFIPAHAIHASAIPAETRTTRIECAMFRLDSLLEAGLPTPSAVKVDVEGGELAVLRGADRLIRTSPPSFIVEANVSMERFGYTRDELVSFLRERAEYSFHAVTANGFPRLGEEGEDAFPDIVALPPGAELS